MCPQVRVSQLPYIKSPHGRDQNSPSGKAGSFLLEGMHAAKNSVHEGKAGPWTKQTAKRQEGTDPMPRAGVPQKTETEADFSVFLVVCKNYHEENQRKFLKTIQMYLSALSFTTYFMGGRK